MLTFNHNPYYSPKLCGLEIVHGIDTAGSYEFDIFCVWKDIATGNLYYDYDSGCSCPEPFDVDRRDLKPLTQDTYYNFKEALKNHSGITKEEIMVFDKLVKKQLKKLGKVK